MLIWLVIITKKMYALTRLLRDIVHALISYNLSDKILSQMQNVVTVNYVVKGACKEMLIMYGICAFLKKQGKYSTQP